MKKYKKRTSKTTKKKTTRRSYRSKNRKSYVPRAPFPEYRFVRLKYTEVINYSIIPNSLVPLYIFQSSLYDPRYNTGGHQPLYFDQLSTLYKKYRVFGMQMRVKMSGNYDYGAVLGLRFTDTSTTEPNNLELFLERPDTITRKGYSYTQGIFLKAYKSVASALGVSKREVVIDDKYASDVSTSPSSMMYAALYAYNFHPSNAQTYTVYTEVIYYAKFYDRVSVSQS